MKSYKGRRRRRRRLIALSIILVTVLAAAAIIFCSREKIEKLWYPREYQAEVEAAAKAYGIEPNWIYAIIKAESDFTKSAVSVDGAIGLMQVMPNTFLEDIREQIGMPEAQTEVLFTAKDNIMAGTYYFAHWYDHFVNVYEMKDPVVEALAAYNAGIGNVWAWMDDDSLSDWRGLFIEKIPFAETKEYVKNVLAYKEKYDAFYGKAALSTGYVSESLAYRWACRYGKEFQIDPRFVMAVMRAESSFNPNDLSKSGAVGLMQIIKGTYVDIKADLNLEEEYEDLYDPQFNVRCGTYYLHWIDERIDGMAQIVASYNVGLATVESWLADPNYSADGKTLIMENIPNDVTKRYVGYVLAYYEEYCARYPEV